MNILVTTPKSERRNSELEAAALVIKHRDLSDNLGRLRYSMPDYRRLYDKYRPAIIRVSSALLSTPEGILYLAEPHPTIKIDRY